MDLGDIIRSLGQSWPARAAQTAWQGLTLPGDVYQGNVSMIGPDGRTNPAVIDRAADLAGTVTLGAGAVPAEANALRAGAGRPPRLQSEVMDQLANRTARGVSDEEIEAAIAARQAGGQAAMEARRAEGKTEPEIDLKPTSTLRKAKAAAVDPRAERLQSEVMRLFRERQNDL